MHVFAVPARRADGTIAVLGLSDNPFDLAASIIDATSRLTSHSHGAGKLSSKSLISKMTLRSGVANPPKLTLYAALPKTIV
jgi:hypothetical protein